MRERRIKVPEGFVSNLAVDLSAIAVGAAFILKTQTESVAILGEIGIGAAMLIAGTYGLYAEAREVVRVNRRNSMIPPNSLIHPQ